MVLGKVLISMPVRPEHREQFQQAVSEADLVFAKFSELDEGQLASFDAVVGNPDAATLEKLTGLRFLQLISSGVPAHCLGLQAKRPGLLLCSASGAYGQAISEHMLAALLALMKRLPQYKDAMKTGAWASQGDVRSPRGMSVLVIGAGSIGTAFARLVKLLGARTVGVRRAGGGEMEGFDEMHTFGQLDALLPQADVVALAVPETPQTIGLMGASRFALLKPGSYLLNVGRGSTVDQHALLDALRTGRLAGASIDVTTPEPLPANHPLWQEKNLLITPHISGYFHLRATQDAVVSIACDNLSAFPQGPFKSRVDDGTGYRARQ